MAKHVFSIKESIKYGWNTTLSQPIIIFYLFVAIAGTEIVKNVLFLIFSDSSEGIQSVITAVLNIISIILSIGMIRVVLQVYQKKALVFENLYQDWKLIGWYLLAAAINIAVVVAGFIVFIIPGIYIAIRLSMWPYLMLEGEKNSFEALKKSWNLTNGIVTKLLGLYLVQILLILLGVVFFLVGLFIAIPVVSLSHVYIYKKISEKQPRNVLEK